MNGPFGLKRGPRAGLPGCECRPGRGGRGERSRLGVRRFSKLPLPPRSGTLWRSKSMAVLAPSSYGPPMDTGAGAGRILFHRGARPELPCLFPTGRALIGGAANFRRALTGNGAIRQGRKANKQRSNTTKGGLQRPPASARPGGTDRPVWVRACAVWGAQTPPAGRQPRLGAAGLIRRERVKNPRPEGSDRGRGARAALPRVGMQRRGTPGGEGRRGAGCADLGRQTEQRHGGGTRRAPALRSPAPLPGPSEGQWLREERPWGAGGPRRSCRP